jgi:N-acetylmuramoyl-L-alanine amidase
MARDWDPDLFISLHHNSVAAASDPLSDRGPHVFYHYAHSRALAEAVAAQLAAVWATDTPPRVAVRNLRVNCNITLCPSVLVESAFMCNPADEERLRRIETVRVTARAVAQGVLDLFPPPSGRVHRQ